MVANAPTFEAAPDPQAMSRGWAILLAAVSIACLLMLLQWPQVSAAVSSLCQETIGKTCKRPLDASYFYVLALGVLPIALLVERWKPANPDQPAFGAGMTVDGLWFLLFPIAGVTLADWVDDALKSPLRAELDGFSVLTHVPLWVKFASVVLMSDFLAWASHYIRHKVPLFWEFHKIHHSQTQLNYFSAKRLHPLDLVANSLIRFLPWTLLGMNMAIPGYLAFTLFLRVHEMFVHSNIRMNWGVLRYVLVTPQSHRLHHSMLPEHIDVNFGNFLSIWDWMFGTQCKDKDVYPPTGVHDSKCSQGTAPGMWAATRKYVGEMIYPVRVIWGWVRAPRPR